MFNNINSKTKFREKKAIGITAGVLAAILVIGGLFVPSGGHANAKDDPEPVPIETADISETSEDDTFIPEDISDTAVIERELENMAANPENDNRSENAMLTEAQAVAQLNKTDNKDWDGKTIEVWKDGEGWVDAHTNGHWEQVWVEDAPGYDEPVYETVGIYVCNGCGQSFGQDDHDLTAHGEQAMIAGNLKCGSWRVDYISQATGESTHVDAVGHYETRWIED